jgi:release factor glutamine methyltransferase
LPPSQMADQAPSSQAPASTGTWTIGSLVKWATDDFRSRGIENPRLDAEVLVAHALKIDRTRVIIESLRELEPTELAMLRDLVKRRRTHEPIAYLRGFREFYGRPFRVDPRVLIPRPDTEPLVDTALSRSEHVSLSMRLLDLCTGSGCVAITMARQRPTSQVIATDLSADALEVARENAYRLGAYNVGFVLSDLFTNIPQGTRRFDVITANPPYIPSGDIAGLMSDVRDFEPRLALDGGDDGLVIIKKIVTEAPVHLEKGGVLAIEIEYRQAARVVELFEANSFHDVRVDRDYGKNDRVVSGILSSS